MHGNFMVRIGDRNQRTADGKRVYLRLTDGKRAVFADPATALALKRALRALGTDAHLEQAGDKWIANVAAGDAFDLAPLPTAKAPAVPTADLVAELLAAPAQAPAKAPAVPTADLVAELLAAPTAAMAR